MEVRRCNKLLLVVAFAAFPLQLFCAQDNAPVTAVLKVSGASIDVTLPDGAMKLSRDELLGWVKASAAAVANYYGHFPVPHLTLKIRSSSGSGIRHGVTYPKDGGLILISVGNEADVAATKDDWVLVHEMIHLAFPSMPDDQHWIEEGISTYVEPVARARTGGMTAAEVWRAFVIDMPKGEPGDGDQGLDKTHTWGRTYWGGAMFCLAADVRIRERTKDHKGLEDALRGINNSGGNITEDWDIEKALAIGDKATGTTVLRDLYKEMRDKPAPMDMDQLWKKLGIALKDGTVIFNDKAPEASIRKAITSPSHSSVPSLH
ncbi:MAG TPA: hypothetical protein VGK24_20270 [Candidatus Angelobacter sp.]|jgi:hypothetical protein